MNDEDEIFREFEHTGDLGIELDAPTRADLFARAAVAMSRLMVEREDVRAVEDRRIDVSADSDADLRGRGDNDYYGYNRGDRGWWPRGASAARAKLTPSFKTLTPLGGVPSPNTAASTSAGLALKVFMRGLSVGTCAARFNERPAGTGPRRFKHPLPGAAS